MATVAADKKTEFLRTLPTDDVRQIMWGFADRLDLQMLVQSARSVARGTVARLVAGGARNTHEWTEEKAAMLKEFDAAGLTSAFADPEQGGFIEGPKNLALALIAFELAWVDGGAATGSLATCLALGPIHERGTPEQYAEYMAKCVPAAPGEDRQQWRGSFALTEPLPFVGVETGLLSGRVSIAEWEQGKEPILNVEKRGRFITNMGFANFVTAAVDSGDPRIKGSCFVILEEGDPGLFDRGVPSRKMVHQLSSTSDPAFRLRVPASRIVGGYSVKDGVIVPRYGHGEIIEAVFKRTRVTVGLMTAAKLLSAVEPLIRYQRDRFRGSDTVSPGTPRYELGLQQKQDALYRLVDVWATGEAAAALGFATARQFDLLDPLEKEKDAVLASRGIAGGMSAFKAMRAVEKRALEFLDLQRQPESGRDAARWEDLNTDPLVRYALLDSLASVYCPATKLWDTGHGANVMREAVSLMGGYGITEDCPGFLGHKWMDAQLEATYEGPEAVQRRQLSLTMVNPLFLAQLRGMVVELRAIAARRPGTGACALATAMQMWLWTTAHLQVAKDAEGAGLYHSIRQGVTFPLADALCWLLAAHSLIRAVIELETHGPQNPVVAEGLEGTLNFYRDLCHAQTARAAGEVGRICAELVFGYNRHPAWDDPEACYKTDELIALESVIAGITSIPTDVVDDNGGHPLKAGPCVKAPGLEPFQRLRRKLDGCLTGSGLAKDRAAEALTKVMIPAALDYPA
jgi:alkylation response protein AidB-like acyl-CoA dehydrogenase